MTHSETESHNHETSTRGCSATAVRRSKDSVTLLYTRALVMHSSATVDLSPVSPVATLAPAEACAPVSSPVRLCLLPAGSEATLHSIDDDQARGLLRSLGVMGACRLRVCQAGNCLLYTSPSPRD